MQSERVISDTRQVDVAWLNEVLKRSGALAVGRVQGFDLARSESVNASIARIRVDYESGSVGTQPRFLLLKICKNEPWFLKDSEVYYYARDYVDLKNPPVPTCYNAASSVAGYHILMDDLSSTHQANASVTLSNGIRAAEALADLHAHLWDPRRLSAFGYAVPDQRNIDRYIRHVEPGLLPMLEAVRGDISIEWQKALYDVFANHPAKMAERARLPVGFTVVHGDPNPGNILTPRDATGRVYLVDRQPFRWSLTTWLAVSDIAYMMVHWWDINDRRSLEDSVLREYHRHLVQRGVTDYNWVQLVHDYRLCAVQSLYVPILRCVLKESCEKMKWVWWPQLQKAMTAFFDLRCSELWH
jgi:thiamine kinase-like enzyme